MPFVSKAQIRACYAQNNPKWDPKKMLKETKTPIKDLPERISKKAQLSLESSFQKIAKSLFNPEKTPQIPSRIISRDTVQEEKQRKTQGLSPVEHRNEVTARRTGIVRRNSQLARAV